MPRLLLMRHAKSSWADSGMADHDRPLNERGIAAATAMGQHLAERGIVPDRLLVSTARRTRDTIAGVLGEVAGWPEPLFDERLYAASATRLMAIVRETAADVDTLMLVAHNPGMQMLASEWGGPDAWDRVGKFPTGALAMIDLDGDWPNARSGRLSAFVKPRDL